MPVLGKTGIMQWSTLKLQLAYCMWNLQQWYYLCQQVSWFVAMAKFYWERLSNKLKKRMGDDKFSFLVYFKVKYIPETDITGQILIFSLHIWWVAGFFDLPTCLLALVLRSFLVHQNWSQDLIPFCGGENVKWSKTKSAKACSCSVMLKVMVGLIFNC